MKKLSSETLLALWQEHWCSGVVLELFITLNEEGLKLGTTVLAKRNADGRLELESSKQRILALLLIAYEYPFCDDIIQKISHAERALNEQGAAMMHMHFALAGFRQLETIHQVRELFYANEMLNRGMSTAQVLKYFDLGNKAINR